MIPKVIHYCWFGGKPKPESFYKYLETWQRHLPDYEIREWNESNFDVNICAYCREAWQTRNYAFVSDVCRVWALYEHGGIYLDTDVEVCASFDKYLDLNAFLGIEIKTVSTGVMGSEAKAGWLGHFMDYYRRTHFIDILGHTVRTPNTYLLSRRVLPKVPIADWPTIFPREWFSCKDYWTKEVRTSANTVAIHHFAASWKRKQTLRQKVASRVEGFKVRFFGK